MIIKYKVSGVIEVDLDKEEIKKFQARQSETMKKEYLNELLHNRLRGCEATLEGELSQNINFDELYVESDWDRYAGNMKSKNDQYGTENQNLRSFRACSALFPHTFAEVGLAETEVVADAQPGSSQSGHAPSAHVHTR